MSKSSRRHYHWFQFDINSWKGDINLQECTLGARGFWLEIILLMQRSERYGYLILNGKPMTVTQMATHTNSKKYQVVRYLRELEIKNVISKDKNGVIFSRRMIREAEKFTTFHASDHAPNVAPDHATNTATKNLGKPPKNEPLFINNNNNKNIEEEREERIPPNPPLENQTNIVTLDDRARLFKIGTDFLVEMTGKPISACRGLIGKWLKQCDNEAGWLLQTLETVKERKPYNPEAYICKIVQQSTTLQPRQKFEKRDPRQEMREDWHLTNSLQEFREKYDRNDDLNDPLWYIPEHLRQKQIAGGSK